MKYISMPPKARVDTIADMDEFYKVQEVMLRQGFSISHFGPRSVSFYQIKDRDAHWCVPIDSRHTLERKDFAMFFGIVQKLDAAEKKAKEHLFRSLGLDENGETQKRSG